MSEPCDSHELNELSFLISQCLEGSITRDDAKRLETLLESKKVLRDYYQQYLSLYCDLKGLLQSAQVPSPDLELCRDAALWNSLAEYEKTAPAVEVPKQESPLLDAIPQTAPTVPRRVSKFSIYSLVLCSAALVFVLAYAFLVSVRRGIEVATLHDSLNAKWADAAGTLVKGARVATGSQSFVLQEGCVELLFDNQAKIIVEAPAKFRVLAEDRIGLTYGKVYAAIPKNAIGFSVYTPIAKIVDMGTEFGVEADLKGSTQLHVFKGRTVLLVGREDQTINVEVCAGQARKASQDMRNVTEIPLQEHRFIRRFDSTNQIVWRGQATLDLADMVRNGNGLGTGNSQMRLNYLKGFTTERRGGETLIAEAYLPIKEHPFIDGIFIPNGKTVVSSRGDTFDGFLITSGVHCADLFGNPPPETYYHDDLPRTIRFNGQEYGERGKSCIFMPASNHGITFDLEAIRRHYGRRIVRFTAQVGLVHFDNKRCNENFYVLVDGQPRYSLLGYTQKGVLNDVSIPLKDTDRFLTLAATENVDQRDYMLYSTLRDNWCIFAEPILVFQ
jgi:hypothetical protein